jgi:aminoacyl tRNA synthase complex-interacting multifunctional protein 1
VPAEFQNIVQADFRVGKIVECKKHPDSEKLYVEQIDLGEGRLRTIGSGLQPFCSMEEMLTGLVVVWANLKPRKLADLMSEGMVLCASNAEHTHIEIMRPPAGAKIGDRVVLADGVVVMPQEIQPVLNPKKKIVEAVMPDMKTNNNREFCWKGHKLVCSAGPIVSKTLCNVQVS